MTTVEERIAAITAQALAEGRTATRPEPSRSASFSNREPAADAPAPVPDVLSRPLPCAWSKPRPEPNKWDRERASDRRRDIEVRLAAGLVAKALGDDWRREIEEQGYHVSIYLVHRDGLRLRFSVQWREPRYTITPVECRNLESVPNSITVSATRSPLSIARDIQRRLLNVGAFDAHVQTRTERGERYDDQTQRRLLMLRFAKTAGHFLLNNRPHHSSYPETNRMELGGGILHIASDYLDRRVLTLETFDDDLLDQIIRLIRDRKREDRNED